mmetsp:Transcript_96557/g.275511  ORF Transcript_96557/g.275511 Transcript_96557/m.275511 type:complete len:342 (-) Transcript_96557:530-1555(-)
MAYQANFTTLSVAVRALFGPINTPVPATQWFPSLVETLPTLAGKTIAVTGCTSGTGFVLARTAVELGAARVVLLNRASPRADSALEKLKAMPDVTTNVIHVDCDLSSFASVREAAAAVREAVGELDVLCLNAGVMGLLDAATPDGFDVQMQPNHLSQFLLTALLWDLLEATADKKGEARVVNHSSGARNAPFLPLTAEYLQKNGGNLGGDGGWGMQKWQRYQQTKLANMVFHYALTEYASARADEGGGSVKVVAAHPGPTNTGLQAKAGSGSWLDNFINGGATEFGHSPEDGAMGIVRASVASDVEVRTEGHVRAQIHTRFHSHSLRPFIERTVLRTRGRG